MSSWRNGREFVEKDGRGGRAATCFGAARAAGDRHLADVICDAVDGPPGRTWVGGRFRSRLGVRGHAESYQEVLGWP